jgi:hypothetical protein
MATNTTTDYAALLPRLLPPSFANPLLHVLTTAIGIGNTLTTHLAPFLNRLVTQPDVASILLLLVVLFISLKVLDMMYRMVLFWINLALRLAFWGAVLGMGLWVWQRGPDGAVADLQYFAEYWLGQYERYSSEIKTFQQQKEDQIRLQARQQKTGWR